jgi:hypothetical protein
MPDLTKRTRKEKKLTAEEFRKFAAIKGTRGAGLYECMGPQWQNIYWSHINRPYVNTSLTYKQVLELIK